MICNYFQPSTKKVFLIENPLSQFRGSRGLVHPACETFAARALRNKRAKIKERCDQLGKFTAERERRTAAAKRHAEEYLCAAAAIVAQPCPDGAPTLSSVDVPNQGAAEAETKNGEAETATKNLNEIFEAATQLLETRGIKRKRGRPRKTAEEKEEQARLKTMTRGKKALASNAEAAHARTVSKA